VTIYHSGDAPTGEEIALVEDRARHGIFTGSTPTSAMQPCRSMRRSRPTIRHDRNAAGPGCRAARADDDRRTADTGGIRNRFTDLPTAALRLPNNLAMEIALLDGRQFAAVSSVRLRTGVETIQEAATLAQAVPQAAIFSGRTPAVGDTVVSLRSMDGSTDAPRVVTWD